MEELTQTLSQQILMICHKQNSQVKKRAQSART